MTQLVVKTQHVKMMVFDAQDLMQGAWKALVFATDEAWVGVEGTGDLNMSEGEAECGNDV